MKKFAALTTILLATALVSPMALAKGINRSVHSPKTKVIRAVKAAHETKKMAHAKSGHQRKARKNIVRKPVIKGQQTQPTQV